MRETQDRRDWVTWVRVLVDPNEKVRGFSLEGLEFKAKKATPVEDEMYGTLPGDVHTQAGKFWVISEEELMRVCPKMEEYAKGEDWFFPVEFCDPVQRPYGINPVLTRDATVEEKTKATNTFKNVAEQLNRLGKNI